MNATPSINSNVRKDAYSVLRASATGGMQSQASKFFKRKLTSTKISEKPKLPPKRGVPRGGSLEVPEEGLPEVEDGRKKRRK